MELVELIDLEDSPDEMGDTLKEVQAVYGQTLNTWRAIAHNPVVLDAYLPFVRAVFGSGSLDQRTKDLVAVRVCYLNQCRYSLSHRVASARRQGVSDDDLAGLADPESHSFSEAEKAALAFAEELTIGPASVTYEDGPQVVSDSTLGSVKQLYSDAAINDLAISVGLWNMLTRYHRVMGLELDMPPPPASLDVG